MNFLLSNIIHLRFAPKWAKEKTIFDFTFGNLKGGELDLDSYRGKAILLVNTASECSFTPQYEELQELWELYRMKGLVVIGVPCNDFGKQEPGSASQIRKFCRKEYKISFPVTEREVIKGPYAHLLFKWLKARYGGAIMPRWNFYKYLFSPEGELVDFFITFTKPSSKRVHKAIEKHLPK